MFAPRFVIPDFNGEQNPEMSKAYMRILLDCLFSLDLVFLRAHPETPSIYQCGIRYIRDARGTEDWKTPIEVLASGGADCKSLACWRAAELVLRGVKAFPQFRWVGKGDNATFHIVVQHPSGQIEDPSKLLGMTGAY